MAQHIGALALLVADYDQAIAFFTQGLGFELLEDTPLDEPGKPGKRWVRVAPRGPGFRPVAGAGRHPEQRAAIGQQGAVGSSCSSKPTTSGAITSACRRTVSTL